MKKQLMRSRKNNVLAGVCGGIAEYFNIDVIVVRLIWVVSALFNGPGLGIYILCAIIIPKAPYNYDSYDEDYVPDYDEDKSERSKTYMALGLIGIGIYLAVRIIFPWLSFKYLWPVALIGVGVMLLNKEKYTEDAHE
jgi:phage shock protein PspC (stress-responsive transcriptional regulator)